MTDLARVPALVSLCSLLAFSGCGGGGYIAANQTGFRTAPSSALGLRCWTPEVFEKASYAIFSGINNKGDIPGSYLTSPSVWLNFVLYPPYRHIRWSPTGLVVTAISNDGKIVVGYTAPLGSLGIQGFVKEGGLFTLLRDPNEGKGGLAVTELLAVNDAGFAVGFYFNKSGLSVPFEVDISKISFTDLKPPGALEAVATGINEKNDVSGWESASKGAPAFLLKSGTYYPLSYPHAARTYALGLSDREELVGFYTDGKGASHGFLLTDPVGHPQWRSFDDPHADGGTTLTGINDYGDFDGYYNQAGKTKPFLCQRR